MLMKHADFACEKFRFAGSEAPASEEEKKETSGAASQSLLKLLEKFIEVNKKNN